LYPFKILFKVKPDLKRGVFMFLRAIITGLVILAGGIFLFTKGRGNARRLGRYEDDNRMNDGNIYFDSIEDSRTHGADRNLARVMSIMGFLTALFGLILLGYGFNLFSYP
jgi:hypothetical protein